MKKSSDYLFHPMCVQVKTGSQAEKIHYRYAGLPGNPLPMPKALATGIAPSPTRDLLFHGGKTVPVMQFQNLYVGGEASWQESDITNIDRAIATAMSEPRLENVMVQYFPGRKISCTAIASRVLESPKPGTVSQGDVEALLRKLHAQGALAGHDFATTIFNFVLPRGTVLTDGALPTGSLADAPSARRAAAKPQRVASSLSGLGGYHGSIHPNKQTTLYFSVNVFSEMLANGNENGIVAFEQPWKNVVATLYHELNEFRTDPDVQDTIKTGDSDFLGWTSRQGQEVGDFPIIAAGGDLQLVFKQVKATGKTFFLPIQFQYSNFVHGPEGPIKKPHQ